MSFIIHVKHNKSILIHLLKHIIITYVFIVGFSPTSSNNTYVANVIILQNIDNLESFINVYFVNYYSVY